MDFVQRGGEGSNPKSKLFVVDFGTIRIQISGRSRAIDPYFFFLGGGGVNKKYGQNPYFHFFFG